MNKDDFEVIIYYNYKDKEMVKCKCKDCGAISHFNKQHFDNNEIVCNPCSIYDEKYDVYYDIKDGLCKF